MFNLLPNEIKAALQREYHYRQAFIWSGAITIVILIATALLVPAYILSLTRNQTLKIERESVEIASQRNAGSAAQVVTAAEKLSTSLTGIPESNVSTLVSQIISSRPAGIVVLRFSFSSALDAPIRAEIQGVAKNREALRGYVRTLEQQPSFGEVAVPIESFTRETNIPFTLTISIRN
ncbi:MAG TPA: hypothetical protein PLF31_02940 [Candidatus Paceibacterota bacterium]|nr:hypothetical protein [Candidatus Paceibacterota bacterium]